MFKPDDQEKDKAVLAEQAYIKAFDYEMNCGCCPQCVLTAVKETVGIVTDETIKASHGLSGGGALSGQGVCGALSGGLVALGAKRGRDADKLDRGRGMANFQAGKKLIEKFKEEFGGLTCEEETISAARDHCQSETTCRLGHSFQPGVDVMRRLSNVLEEGFPPGHLQTAAERAEHRLG